MDAKTHEPAGLGRRLLLGATAGWVLGVGGLMLSGSMNEAEARDSDLGGRHGQDHRGRDKHHGHHEQRRHQRRTRKTGRKDVEVTFINGTSQLLYYKYGTNDTYQQIDLDDRVTVTESSTSLGAILLVRNTTYYAFNAFNPLIGLPYVKIEDANTVVFDESLEEGEQVDSLAFLVKRLTDTENYKVFEVTAHD